MNGSFFFFNLSIEADGMQLFVITEDTQGDSRTASPKIYRVTRQYAWKDREVFFDLTLPINNMTLP